jgi:hypothetical protein
MEAPSFRPSTAPGEPAAYSLQRRRFGGGVSFIGLSGVSVWPEVSSTIFDFAFYAFGAAGEDESWSRSFLSSFLNSLYFMKPFLHTYWSLLICLLLSITTLKKGMTHEP